MPRISETFPSSITAISAATIEDAHVIQLDDLNSLVTNLNIDEAHDNTPDVTLRGVGAFGVVQGVGFYANDVQLFEGQTARPIDIERIEVLKGPQGTLFGGANVGGAIKYVTKDPTSTWENQANVEFGQYDTRNYEAVFSGPLDDKVGIRASVYYDYSRRLHLRHLQQIRLRRGQRPRRPRHLGSHTERRQQDSRVGERG